MNKKVLIVLISVLISVPIIYYFGFRNRTPIEEVVGIEGAKEAEDASKESARIANPAAVYCEEQGGIQKNEIYEKGERGLCVFEDGSQCGQWDFFNKKCNKGDLKIKVLAEGSGRRIDNGDTAAVHYVGTFEDGTMFDSSLERNQSFSFVLGAGQVIKGWDQGVLGMRAGERRTLTITPALAYGETGAGEIIPSNTTLIFIVELMQIK